MPRGTLIRAIAMPAETAIGCVSEHGSLDGTRPSAPTCAHVGNIIPEHHRQQRRCGADRRGAPQMPERRAISVQMSISGERVSLRVWAPR